ncbi:MAG: hypothetical protein PWQ86_82 [Bacillota bacterium]|jgi:hypothetical protein|nr:hypothetical protein [Bacillota bacterium]
MRHSFLEAFKRRLTVALSQQLHVSQPIHTLKAKDMVSKKFNAAPKMPSSLDLEHLMLKIKKLWREYGEEGLKKLTYVEIGRLPWVLFYGEPPKIADDPELTRAILRLAKKRGRRDLANLIHVYFLFYDPLVPGTELLREYITTSLAQYNGKAPRITSWQKRAFPLFTSDGPLNTAKWLITQESSHASLLSTELGLDGELGHGSFAKHLVRHVIELAGSYFPAGLDTAIDLLQNGPAFQDLIPYAANKFITKAGLECVDSVRTKLKTFFLKTLGDPRVIGNRYRWGPVSPEAKRIFTQWISKEDLEFFFNLVDRSSGNRKWIYRRTFWETYLPYMENTWVALGQRARDLINQAEMKEHLENRKFGSLEGAGTTSQSVFFVQMRGYLFVEWSHDGGCRVFKQTDGNEQIVLGKQTYHASQLRRNDYVLYVRHNASENYSWQNRLAQWIMLHLGIKPVKSYRVDDRKRYLA